MGLEGQEGLVENAASILNAVVDAIITIDALGTIQSFNSAAQDMFGYTTEQLIGKPIGLLMPEPFKSNHQEYVARYVAHGDAKIIGVGRELVAEKADGAQFPIYLAISEIPETKHFVGIVRDLSAQKNAEQALAEQKERVAQVGRLATMGEMTASIAHEINQPLTAISMYAQAVLRMLNKTDADLAKVSDAISKLSAQSLRAGDVIERIQRFVHNAGSERSMQNVNKLVGEIRQLAAGDARLHGIKLQLDLAHDLPPALCDPIQIQQVVLNLVRNAIDAMYEIQCCNGNTVSLRTQLLDNSINIRVEDSGTGVPATEEKHIFQPFHTTKLSGMGMGLSICRSIVEEHGGRLSYQNNSDVGATFYFSLPLGEHNG